MTPNDPGSVNLHVSPGYVNLDIIEPNAMQSGMVAVNAAEVAKLIQQRVL